MPQVTLRRSTRARSNTKFYNPTDVSVSPRSSQRQKISINRLSPTSFTNKSYY